MANVNQYTAALRDAGTHHIYSDFDRDQADTEWVDTITDTGTVLMGDATDGTAVLTPSDGTVADNDEAYLATPNEGFIFAAGRPIYGRARIKFTEVAAGVANVAFGFQNAVGANSILDDGAGLKVSGSTLGIYKVDGESVWRCVSSCNGTSTVTASSKAAVAATWYKLEIFCYDTGLSTKMGVVYKVDGEYLKDSNGNVIRHEVAVASATEMSVFFGIKLGAATNNDTLIVDNVYVSQKRSA